MEGPEIQYAEAVIDNGRFGQRTVRFETGRLAKQAAGSALVSIDEDTTLLSATAVGKSPREGFDFFPLTVDVEERMYAAGRIPGSFFRREGRPSTDAILACRLIDRPLRPAFTKGIRNEVQVVVTVLSIDPDEIYNTVAINAASMSTTLSGAPCARRSRMEACSAEDFPRCSSSAEKRPRTRSTLARRRASLGSRGPAVSWPEAGGVVGSCESEPCSAEFSALWCWGKGAFLRGMRW